MSTPRILRLRLRLPWLVAVSAAVLFFLFAPVAVIILFSFNDSSALSLPIERLSLRWYAAIFTSPQFLSALRNAALVGGATALLATLVGTLAAYALARYHFRYKAAVTAAFTLPIALPPLF